MRIQTVLIIGFLGLLTLTFQNCAQYDSSATSVASKPEGQSQTLDVQLSSAARSPSANWMSSVVEFNTYGAYSQDMIAAERIWFGGWISAADPTNYITEMVRGTDPTTVFGPDKIFVTDRALSAAQTQQGVRLAFQLRGYHINDPTVVTPQSTGGIDRSQWLYMYFTMLDNRLAENCRRRTSDILQCPELFSGHDVGMASSVDGGLTWTFRGIVIAAAQSGDGAGAWMPTVIQAGGEIHVYYNTGKAEYSTANIFRQRLSADGLTKLGAPQAVRIPGFRLNDQVHNIDVQAASIAGKRVLLMVSNNGHHNEIRAHFSADGITFVELASGPLLSSGGTSARLITPHIELWGENSLSVPQSSAAVSGDTLAFANVQFTRYGGISGNEKRRQTSISFKVPKSVIDAAVAY